MKKTISKLIMILGLLCFVPYVSYAQSASESYNKGVALMNKGDYQGAIASFKASMAINKSAANVKKCNAQIAKCNRLSKKKKSSGEEETKKVTPAKQLTLSAYTAFRTLSIGERAGGECLPAAADLQGGCAGGAVGVESLGLHLQQVRACWQAFRRLFQRTGGIRPPHALVERIGAVGDAGLAEIVVGEAVGRDEQLCAGVRGVPARDGSDVPSAQTVVFVRDFHPVGTRGRVSLERGVRQVVCRDVALSLDVGSSHQSGCKQNVFEAIHVFPC